MRKLVGLVAACSVAACAADAVVHACGDKFVLIGRAIKYQKAYAAAHPASIVIFDNPGSRVGSVARDLQLQQLLTGAGHRVRVVSTLQSLEQAVASAAPDLLLVDGNDLPQLERSLPRGTAAVLPIAVFQARGKTRHPLAVIDDALKNSGKRTTKS
jgi:hypothetical protein